MTLPAEADSSTSSSQHETMDRRIPQAQVAAQETSWCARW